jgi:hypothetical protein
MKLTAYQIHMIHTSVLKAANAASQRATKALAEYNTYTSDLAAAEAKDLFALAALFFPSSEVTVIS